MKFMYRTNHYSQEDCYFMVAKYVNKEGITISVWNDELGPVAQVTVNPESDTLQPDEIAIKDYSENEGILKCLQEIGLVGEPLRFIRQGSVLLPVCKYNEEVLESYLC